MALVRPERAYRLTRSQDREKRKAATTAADKLNTSGSKKPRAAPPAGPPRIKFSEFKEQAPGALDVTIKGKPISTLNLKAEPSGFNKSNSKFGYLSESTVKVPIKIGDEERVVDAKVTVTIEVQGPAPKRAKSPATEDEQDDDE